MTVLGTDNAQRANQVTWGTASDGQTWAQVRGAMAWSITSNELACNSAAGTFNIFRLGSKTSNDMEVLVRVTPADTTSNTGTVARYSSNTSFYYGVLNSGNVVIGKNNNGFATVASAAFSYSAGTAYWLRFRLVSTALFLKAWADGSAEPSTWNISTTDVSLTSGGFGLATDSSSATNTQFDSFYTVDYANCENLSIADSFLSTESASFAEANSASDAFSVQNGFIPLDSLSAADMLLVNEATSWADLLSITDSFTGTSSPPIPPAVNATMLARKGNAAMLSRKGTITLYGRKQ